MTRSSRATVAARFCVTSFGPVRSGDLGRDPFAVAVPLLFHRTTIRWGLSCFLWAGTVGRSARDLETCYERFGRIYLASASGGRVLADAWQALREHRRQGRRIRILSGSPTGLVSAIARRIDEGAFTVVGSKTRRFAGGFVAIEHCVRERKVTMAVCAGVANGPWHSGYSDSAWDIPMLRRCRERYAVNPTRRARHYLLRAFGDGITVVQWR